MSEESLKRAACLIAAQLPDDAHEAMRVLEYAAGIMRHLHGTLGAEVIPLSIGARTSLAIVREGGQVAPTYSLDRANPG